MGGIQPIGPNLPTLPVQPTAEVAGASAVQPAAAPAVQDVLALSDVGAPLSAMSITASGEIVAVSPAIRVDRVLALREAIAAGTFETDAVVNGTVDALWNALQA